MRVIYHVSEALRRVVPCERLYLLSLGSQQGNRHVHWHLAPLPPGVPYDEQQLAALAVEGGILEIPEAEMAGLARRIRKELARQGRLGLVDSLGQFSDDFMPTREQPVQPNREEALDKKA